MKINVKNFDQPYVSPWSDLTIHSFSVILTLLGHILKYTLLSFNSTSSLFCLTLLPSTEDIKMLTI